jgi:ATP-dependent DNA helicase PIF1
MSELSVNLVEWQEKALNVILNDLENRFGPENTQNHSFVGTFIPGPPGSGKSTLVNYGVDTIKRLYPNLQVNITATTGAAATRLKNAMTLASWLQIGSQALKLDKFDDIWPEISKRQPDRPKECDILIIDEASMLSQKSFDSLNRICQRLRKNPVEFGGIYVIILGDPMQLPPVPHDMGPGFGRVQREFIASCLERQYPGYNYVVANQMMRAEDKEFMRCLLSLVSPKPNERARGVREFREACYKNEMDIDEVLDTQEETGSLILSPVKDEAYSCNAYNGQAKKRAEENEDSRVVVIKDVQQKHSRDDKEITKLLGGKRGLDLEEKAIRERETWPSLPEIRTKQTYMIRANFTTLEGVAVCNGDTGEVIDYNPVTNCAKFNLYRLGQEITIPRHEFSSEWCAKISYTALPLIPASAITIHKAQGATVSGIILDPRRFWHEEYLCHKYYTSFSRVRKMEDITIASYILDDCLDHPIIQEKLEFIWNLPYMKEYLTPDTV